MTNIQHAFWFFTKKAGDFPALDRLAIYAVIFYPA